MKLDIDYIEQILTAVQEHEKSGMYQSDLLEAIEADKENEDHIDKFYYHMKRIEEAGYLESPHIDSDYRSGFGFSFSFDGMDLLDTEYELTWMGCNFLEAMRNDTVKSKIADWFKDMTFEQIKTQAPVILAEFIKKGFFNM